MDLKICPICKKELFKPKKYSYEQWNKTIYCSRKCNHLDKEYINKLKIAAIKNGSIPPNFKGKKRSIEFILKNSGKNNYRWCGGISKLKIPKCYWNIKNRTIARERDKHTCQMCKNKWIEGNKVFDTHHIDYKKENGDINNIITLCHKCHMRTNINREYWIKYFNKIINKRKEK